MHADQEDGARKFALKVACHAGFRGEETPRRMTLGASKIEVGKILDRWLAPDHRYFKLLGDDGAIYIVRHDERNGAWELTFFQAPDCRP